MITNIENNAHFTFDFLMLLTLASIIAFIGLGEVTTNKYTIHNIAGA